MPQRRRQYHIGTYKQTITGKNFLKRLLNRNLNSWSEHFDTVKRLKVTEVLTTNAFLCDKDKDFKSSLPVSLSFTVLSSNDRRFSER